MTGILDYNTRVSEEFAGGWARRDETHGQMSLLHGGTQARPRVHFPGFPPKSRHNTGSFFLERIR